MNEVHYLNGRAMNYTIISLIYKTIQMQGYILEIKKLYQEVVRTFIHCGIIFVTNIMLLSILKNLDAIPFYQIMHNNTENHSIFT